MSFPYVSRDYDPPAPCLEVLVGHPTDAGLTRRLLAQVDTGADISVVPHSLVKELNLPFAGAMLVVGYDTAPSRVPVHYLDLELADTRLALVKFVAADRGTMPLGRDVLRHFIPTLDGKAENFDLRDP